MIFYYFSRTKTYNTQLHCMTKKTTCTHRKFSLCSSLFFFHVRISPPSTFKKILFLHLLHDSLAPTGFVFAFHRHTHTGTLHIKRKNDSHRHKLAFILTQVVIEHDIKNKSHRYIEPCARQTEQQKN